MTLVYLQYLSKLYSWNESIGLFETSPIYIASLNENSNLRIISFILTYILLVVTAEARLCSRLKGSKNVRTYKNNYHKQLQLLAPTYTYIRHAGTYDMLGHTYVMLTHVMFIQLGKYFNHCVRASSIMTCIPAASSIMTSIPAYDVHTSS